MGEKEKIEHLQSKLEFVGQLAPVRFDKLKWKLQRNWSDQRTRSFRFSPSPMLFSPCLDCCLGQQLVKERVGPAEDTDVHARAELHRHQAIRLRWTRVGQKDGGIARSRKRLAADIGRQQHNLLCTQLPETTEEKKKKRKKKKKKR